MRIRFTDRKTELFVIDACQDDAHVGDVKWFTDIHPNSAGVKLAVETEVAVIQG